MIALTRPQALALLDQLRAEILATDEVHVLVEWHPGLLAVNVADHRRGPPFRLVELPFRLVEILQLAERAGLPQDESAPQDSAEVAQRAPGAAGELVGDAGKQRRAGARSTT